MCFFLQEYSRTLVNTSLETRPRLPPESNTPRLDIYSLQVLCENDPMSGESRGALGDADTREWHFFHQRFSSAQRKPLCSSERISITRCRMGELNETGCYRVYLGSVPCSQSVPEKVSPRCQCSPFCHALERRSKGERGLAGKLPALKMLEDSFISSQGSFGGHCRGCFFKEKMLMLWNKNVAVTKKELKLAKNG